MKIQVKQLYKRTAPKTGITTKFGSPVEILGPAPAWRYDGVIHEQMRVGIWSPLFGWKEQTVLKSSLVYKSKKGEKKWKNQN